MQSGDVDLNGYILSLRTTGKLMDETEQNRIFGASGTITCQRILNAPASIDVAGLGAEITSSSNMGLTTISRGHGQLVASAGFSMNRFYEIHPANNNNLNATLKLRFYEDELNTSSGLIDKNTLKLWRYDDVEWFIQNSTIDMVSNQLTKTAIPQFSTWTAGSGDLGPLPITLVEFDVVCINGEYIVEWTTASEINNKEFIIQESTDGLNWVGVAQEDGAGNSNTSRKYSKSFTSTNSSGSYVRLKQIDYNGDSEVFDPVFVSCQQKFTNEVTLFPNPAVDYVDAKIVCETQMMATISIFSTSGQILLNEKISLTSGANIVRLDVSSLPPAVYHLSISNDKRIEITGSKSIIKK